MHSALRPSLAALVAASLSACGGSSKPPPAKSVVMNGVVTLFPPAASFFVPTPDITKFQLDVLDPVKVLLGQGTAARICSPAQPLSLTVVPGQPLPTGSYTCAIPDATLIFLGIVGNIVDNNTTQIQTFTTSTGLHGPFCADSACANVTPGQVFSDTAPAFIIPDAFHEAVGALYTPQRTLAQLKGAGVIVVFVVDPVASQPIAGATVTAPGNYAVFYPDFGAPGAGNATDSSGVAYVTGPATTSTPINIAASATGLPTCATATSTSCLPRTQAGLLPQLAFVAVVAKQ